MRHKCLKSLLVLAFSLFLTVFATTAFAQEHGKEPATETAKEGLDMKEVIFGHIMDAHEFHFFTIKHEDGTKTEAAIPLPVILYSPQKGFSFFMASKFEEAEKEGKEDYEGYKLAEGKIVATDASVKVYDFSLTRNVVQMILALALLVWILTSIGKKYKSGQGVTSAPKGMQSLIEPVVVFVRDDVAKPNLGYKADKYLPYLLTIFFFILINNIFGLIPGTANVTGNIAFTVVLGVITFIVMLASSNKHFWLHIFNPPGVPGWVKVILVPVEFMSLFLKPFSLIIRLFANMVAGHIIIICLISLIFIFGQISPALGYSSSIISIPFTIFIYFIEILVAFLQAYIFTTLTAVLIGSAIEGDHHHEGHNSHDNENGLYDDAVII
ncbi:MAG: F0F1 ATP synthase subunit A [Ferruginibacter sp.]